MLLYGLALILQASSAFAKVDGGLKVKPLKPVPLLVGSGSFRREKELRTTVTPPGFWMDWTSWSECTRSCGGGSFMRMRMCMPMGSNCVGRLVEMRGCNAHACPLAVWTAWASWGSCAMAGAACQRKRERACAPIKDGCTGRKDEVQSCDLSVCETTATGRVESDWTEWSSCSAACKATRTRTCTGDKCDNELELDFIYCRTGLCTSPAGEWGEWASAGTCQCPQGTNHGISVRTRSCPIGRVCEGRAILRDTCYCSDSADAAGWSTWQSWSSCDCENQSRSRKRSCEKVAGNCPGDLEERQNCACLEGPDAGKYWEHWSGWSLCPSINCRGANQYRERKCVADDKARFCSNRDAELETKACPCNETSVVEDPSNPYQKYTDWTEWSECDCPNNRQYRRRSCANPRPPIKQIEPDCKGPLDEDRLCSGPMTCDPVNGGWTTWSAWSGCPNNCGCFGIRSYRVRDCADPIPVNRGRSCFGFKVEYEPCNWKPCPNVDRINGQATEWSAWTDCDASCLPGRRHRFRSCTEPKPHNGGTYCGEVAQSKPCRGTGQCDLVLGGFSNWSPWSDCSATCGRGMRSSIRVCNNPTPSSRILPCLGRVKWYKPCFDLPTCPKEEFSFV